LANVVGGAAVGIRGIQFHSPAQLEKDLYALGIHF
jgi:hypothetical protein